MTPEINKANKIKEKPFKAFPFQLLFEEGT
jgi:hypothetical protein